MKLKQGKKSGLKGSAAIQTATIHFEASGFQVFGASKHPSANGTDLVVTKDGQAFTVEVKQVCAGKKNMSVKPVNASGRGNHWIAMVHRDLVIVQPMRDHLALCDKTGARGVTALFKLKEMLITEGKERVAGKAKAAA